MPQKQSTARKKQSTGSKIKLQSAARKQSNNANAACAAQPTTKPRSNWGKTKSWGKRHAQQHKTKSSKECPGCGLPCNTNSRVLDKHPGFLCKIPTLEKEDLRRAAQPQEARCKTPKWDAVLDIIKGHAPGLFDDVANQCFYGKLLFKTFRGDDLDEPMHLSIKIWWAEHNLHQGRHISFQVRDKQVIFLDLPQWKQDLAENYENGKLGDEVTKLHKEREAAQCALKYGGAGASVCSRLPVPNNSKFNISSEISDDEGKSISRSELLCPTLAVAEGCSAEDAQQMIQQNYNERAAELEQQALEARAEWNATLKLREPSEPDPIQQIACAEQP